MRQGKTISSCFFQSFDVDIFRGPTTHIGGIWRDRQRFDDFSVHGGSGKEVFFFLPKCMASQRFQIAALVQRHANAVTQKQLLCTRVGAVTMFIGR